MRNDDIPQYQSQIPRQLGNMRSFVITELFESTLVKASLTNAMTKEDIFERPRWYILQQYTPCEMNAIMELMIGESKFAK